MKTRKIWKLVALSLVLLGASQSHAVTALVSDNFNDNSLNGALWSTNTAIPQGSASVIEQNMRIELTNRGYLNTVASFAPGAQAEDGLRITGTWTFNRSDDFLQILTRSDGQVDPGNCCGETFRGIEFIVAASGVGNNMTISGRGATITGITNAGALGASAGETYNFEIRDNGTNLTFTMNQVGGSKQRTVTAASTFSPGTNLVTFHNREFNNGVSEQAFLDNVAITSPTSLQPLGVPVLLQDNFNDNSIDGSKWLTNTGVGGSSVTETNGRIQMAARGYLVTQANFDPVANNGLQIAGRWTFGADDFMQILTRSDGQIDPGNCCGETLNGIEFFAFEGNSMQISRRVAGVNTVLTSGGVDILPGDVFDFLITDDGTNVTFLLSQVGGDGTTAFLSTSDSTSYALDRIVFHNREGGHTSNLDDVFITALVAVPEPASLMLLLIGGGAIMRRRRLA
ncbi:MAG: PEP-CTERM sorting domain-containing protein [Phycisphaeraceae bacterium]